MSTPHDPDPVGDPGADDPPVTRGRSSDGSSRRGVFGLVALLCLVVGVAGGIAIGYSLDDDDGDSAVVTASPLAKFAAAAAVDPSPGTETTTDGETTDTGNETTDTETETTTETTDTTGTGTTAPREPTPTDLAVMNRVPATDLPCRADAPDAGATTFVVCGRSNEDVLSFYLKFDSTAALRAAYADVLSEVGVTEGQTPASCPNVVPSDLAITRGGITTGKLVCFELDGKQGIAWTSEPLNTLVLARAPEGMSAIELHEWWQQTDRPVLTDDEVAFYGRVPESHRADCTLSFVSFSQVQAVSPPERGSEATCFVPVPDSASGSTGRIGVNYTQHFNPEAMNRDYAALQSDWGTTPDSGNCTTTPPGEGTWQQGDQDIGRVACTNNQQLPVMTWTTDPVNIVSLAVAAPGMSLSDLWDWWVNESGPLFRNG